MITGGGVWLCGPYQLCADATHFETAVPPVSNRPNARILLGRFEAEGTAVSM